MKIIVALGSLGLILMLVLSGCAKGNSSVQPDLIPYSKAVQNKAADEMESGMCPTLNIMIDDYGMIRDQIRG